MSNSIYKRFDAQQLHDLGIEFAETKDTDEFLKILNDELDAKICNKLKEIFPGEQQKERIILKDTVLKASVDESNDEKTETIKKIIKNAKCSLKSELIEHRKDINGINKTDESIRMGLKVEELDLSVRGFNALKRAGIYTVGEIVSYGDLSTIRFMSPHCIEEINYKLNWILTCSMAEGDGEIHQYFNFK